jgi:hypothetical protein
MPTPQDESYPAYCRQRAEECRCWADHTVARDLKDAFLEMERIWLAAAEGGSGAATARTVLINFNK